MYFYAILTVFLVLIAGCTHNTVIPLHKQNVPASQLSTLVLPVEVDLVAVDGQELTGFSRPPLEVSYVLLAGEHELVLQYERIWPNEVYADEVVSSPLQSMKVTLDPGARYRISNDLPDNYLQARAFVAKPVFEIVSSAGEVSTSHQLPPSLQPSGVKGMLIGVKNTPLENLKYWWEEASEDEKATFLEVISEKTGQ